LRLNHFTGIWKEVGTTTVAPGSGPRHIQISRNGKVLYLCTELSNSIQIFTIASPISETGASTLTHISTTSILPPGAADYPGYILGAGEIRLAPDEKFVYVSNRNDNNTAGDAITVFPLLTPTTLGNPSYYRTGGRHIRGMEFDSSYGYLAAGNMYSASVVVFQRNANTGSLTNLVTLDLPSGTQPTSFIWLSG